MLNTIQIQFLAFSSDFYHFFFNFAEKESSLSCRIDLKGVFRVIRLYHGQIYFFM